MIHFLLAHWIAICVVGILANWAAYANLCSRQQEGAMGTEIIIPFTFIPFLIAIPEACFCLGLWK